MDDKCDPVTEPRALTDDSIRMDAGILPDPGLLMDKCVVADPGSLIGLQVENLHGHGETHRIDKRIGYS